jgi:glutamate decarboxylase
MSSVPAYTMAPNAQTLKLLRVVVREDFSLQRATVFLRGNFNLKINRLSEADS